MMNYTYVLKFNYNVKVFAGKYITVSNEFTFDPIPTISHQYIELKTFKGKFWHLNKKRYWVYTNPETKEKSIIYPNSYIVLTHFWRDQPIYEIVEPKCFEKLFQLA